MERIYTFDAESITHGTISIQAETFEQACEKLERLQDADELRINIESGAGDTTVNMHGREDEAPGDGAHMMQTPRENAREHEEALAELDDEHAREAADDLGADFLANKEARP